MLPQWVEPCSQVVAHFNQPACRRLGFCFFDLNVPLLKIYLVPIQSAQFRPAYPGKEPEGQGGENSIIGMGQQCSDLVRFQNTDLATVRTGLVFSIHR